MEKLSGLKPLTALGYFEVTKATFLSIITNAVAYLVIILQFPESNDSSAEWYTNQINTTTESV